MPENGTGRFRIECSDVLKGEIRRIHRMAATVGQGAAVTAALIEIADRLQRDPYQAGEPGYRLPALRLRLRTVVVRPIVIHYAIHQDHPIVFIKSVRLLGHD